jgi:hypothetical protein
MQLGRRGNEMTEESFSETISSTAAELIESMRLPNGMRLLKPSAAARVREIYKEHMARRGGRGRRRSAVA